MKWVPDPTRRFARRPLYEVDEIELGCDRLVAAYFQQRKSAPEYPLSTAVLSKILEQHALRCDFGRDLREFGDDVEGLTQFSTDHKPIVYISSHLRDVRLVNRRRMTIAHELGHVHFHAILFAAEQTLDLFSEISGPGPTYCRRSTITRGGDWMEWQASYAAGALLMPSTTLRELIEQQCSRLGIKTPLRHDDPRARYLASAVGDFFQTSADAAAVRLLQRGYIEPKQVQSFKFHQTSS